MHVQLSDLGEVTKNRSNIQDPCSIKAVEMVLMRILLLNNDT
jgi:hypothetical protein